MLTITPRTSSVTETDVLSAASAGEEKIMLVVGNIDQAITLHAPTFRHEKAEDVQDAQRVIARMLHSMRRMPNVIICTIRSGCEKDLAQWENYFRQHTELASIPFLLYSPHMSDSLRQTVRNYQFIDDVITESCLTNQLENKINFVYKFKRMQVFSHAGVPAQKKAPLKASRINYILKRTFDISVSGTLLLALTPVMAVIAACIRWESKGPVFYSSPRAGKNYKVFKFYKFRTMVPGADKQLQQLKHLNQYSTEENAPVFYKMSNDPRITKLGNLLRNTSLDELPQLLNVLKGDMSLVGNRPLPLYEATTLTTDTWAERFLAPAGITGLWQISKRGKKEMSAEERIQLDIEYANKHSFGYDMWLIANTPKALIQKDNV